MFPENIESAYRFCFGRPVKGSHHYDKTRYDFEPEQKRTYSGIGGRNYE
jgi:hypothetical protein